MNSRLNELDLLRGISVIGMILVITPGAWSVGYSWLNHADWEGLVAVDMIAPAFMFCIGFAIPLSLKNRIEKSTSLSRIATQIIKRGLLLIAIGIFIHWTGNTDFSTLRIPGVLQRIGATYIAVSLLLLTLNLNNTKQFNPQVIHLSIITALLLITSWLLFYIVPTPGFSANEFSSEGSWASYIDQHVFGIAHMWEWGLTDGIVTYDPDGIICSINTCGNVLIGAIIGLMYQQNSRHITQPKLLSLGLILIGVGLTFSSVCPIIKKIWTSSFVLISSGMSIITFCFFRYLVSKRLSSYKILRTIFHPIYAYGSNALLAFIISWLGLFWFLNQPIYKGQDIRSLGFNTIKTTGLSDALSSLIFGVIFLVILYFFLAYLRYKKWFFRI